MSLRTRLKSAALWFGAAAAFGAAPALAAREAPPPPQRLVQKYDPAPAMWLLADDDTSIYMLGTFHVLPPGFRWRSPAIEAAVEAADELVVESYEAPGTSLPPEAFRLARLDAPRPLLDRVPEEKRAVLAKAVARGPLPLEAYSMMKTWTAGLLLGMAGVLGDYGVDDPDQAPGVEDWLEAAFRSAGKPIGQIEDPVAVLGTIDSLPEDVQLELLVSGLEELADPPPPDHSDVHAWARGKVDEIAPEMEKEMPPAVFDALVRRRNAAWAEWLANRLDRPGTILVAVGAGHFAGDSAVQNMLEARGFRARRID
jgi:uncharacterized protein